MMMGLLLAMVLLLSVLASSALAEGGQGDDGSWTNDHQQCNRYSRFNYDGDNNQHLRWGGIIFCPYDTYYISMSAELQWQTASGSWVVMD